MIINKVAAAYLGISFLQGFQLQSRPHNYHSLPYNCIRGLAFPLIWWCRAFGYYGAIPISGWEFKRRHPVYYAGDSELEKYPIDGNYTGRILAADIDHYHFHNKVGLVDIPNTAIIYETSRSTPIDTPGLAEIGSAMTGRNQVTPVSIVTDIGPHANRATLKEVISYSEFCDRHVDTYSYMIKYVSEDVIMRNPERYVTIVTKHISYMCYLPKEIRAAHPDLCARALEIGAISPYQTPFEVLEKHPEAWRAWLSKNPHSLSEIPESIREKHPDACIAAALKYNDAIQYVSESVQMDNPEACITIVHRNWFNIKYIKPSVLEAHPQIYDDILEEHPHAARYLPTDLQKAAEEKHPKVKELMDDIRSGKYIGGVLQLVASR